MSEKTLKKKMRNEEKEEKLRRTNDTVVVDRVGQPQPYTYIHTIDLFIIKNNAVFPNYMQVLEIYLFSGVQLSFKLSTC